MTEVATVEPAQVPALASTPSIELTADDISLPKVKLGQGSNDYVEEGLVPKGCIFTASGNDDPDPQVLWEQDQKDAPRFHVITMRKGKSLSDGGELTLFDYDDPNAPADAWVTYNYYIAIPAASTDLPYTFLLSKTGKPAAQNMNMVLAKQAAAGPPYMHAFEVTCVFRENTKGKFYVPQIRNVEADETDVAIAASLANMIPADVPTPTAEPITEQPAI